ncbi:uncharacterized protein CEXT_741991 [Caerostris extrusa]|uniref:Uncharacterized protein n=1 Tax=Caerostris extrusa TaxID=172846 RepID=A0AAV4X487_CAEEX|nr:uncharacterized protein CEXT_741991 [Caerostris extrusa]
MEKKRESAKTLLEKPTEIRFQLCGGAHANSTAFILWVVLSCYSAASERHSEEAKHFRVKNANMSSQNAAADGSLFEVNATYTIWLSGSSVLPRGFLRGLDVSGLVVDDPHLQGLEEGALGGPSTQDFMVDKSSIKEVPDFRFIRDSLKLIYMDNSRLTALDRANLRHLPLLEELSFYNNSIEHVAPDVFQVGLHLSIHGHGGSELLQHLPQPARVPAPDLFEQWSHLKYVDLSHNRLLHVDRLFLPTDPHVSASSCLFSVLPYRHVIG